MSAASRARILELRDALNEALTEATSPLSPGQEWGPVLFALDDWEDLALLVDVIEAGLDIADYDPRNRSYKNARRALQVYIGKDQP